MHTEPSAVIRYDIGACGSRLPGLLLVAERGQGLCAILMGDDEDSLRAELRLHFPQGYLHQDPAEMAAPLAAAQHMLAHADHELDWPLEPQLGTPFQQQVWSALRQIPSGQTVSYTELAQRIGQPSAARAVASACAANPLAVVVPCHRVVRSDGGLSGYRWGEDRKRTLLALEARH